jgi:hypothetical protein
VDLANMMLCLALRSSPEQVYQRALQHFTVEEITEGFAAARGLALPSQLRHLLRAQGRDLHAEFVRLLPSPPQPIRIQRWSARRIGLWAAILAVVVLNPSYIFSNKDAVETPLMVTDVGCGDLEPLWLMAQSVPSTSLVPCVALLPAGWSVAGVAVNNGRSVITLNHDRAGNAALKVELRAACDLTGATEVTSERRGARRYVRIDRGATEFSATRSYVVPGGCIVVRFTAPAAQQDLATETASAIGLTTRQDLAEALSQRSDGRLQLDP